MKEPREQVTRLLQAMEAGELRAAEELLPLVYEELRRLAAWRLGKERAGQTLQATALVHEAWLRLGGAEERSWANRAHFFAAAAQAMRRILVDNARRKLQLKRGGEWQRVDLDAVEVPSADSDDKVLMVDEALEELAREEPVVAEVVKLHYFVGLSHEEAAEVLGVSDRTVKRHWSYAKAWLYDWIRSKGGGGSGA
jgi:RNA polymerase sigma factor (TIGR02999 family)